MSTVNLKSGRIFAGFARKKRAIRSNNCGEYTVIIPLLSLARFCIYTIFCYRFIFVFAAAFLALAAAPLYPQQVRRVSHIALRGEPLYNDGFTHFKYVNPDAPKGGTLALHATGTYDNFHRYALRGTTSAGYTYFYDTLMTSSEDETDVLYPLVAESAEYPDDYSYIIFNINKNAKDQDGQPITAEDAAFSFRILFERGVPQFRAYYADVTVKVLDAYRVRFDIGEGRDKERLMQIASFTVFPRRFWEGPGGETLHDFSEPVITPPLGTGPYRITDYKMGQYVTLSRVKNYWAANLPVNRGRYNFDVIRYDYYRDSNVAFEAFKAGEYDFREENSASNWASGYVGKAFETGRIVREEAPHSIAAGVQGLAFNTERPLFADLRVRRAISYFFDFEWMNKNLFYGQYTRTRSYFQNTEYAAAGPPSPDELAVLETLRGKVPDEVFTAAYNPPQTDGSGFIRPEARAALALLAEAGWNLQGGKLLNSKGEQFSFELLIYDIQTERFAIPFRSNLARYGIDMRLRLVDTSQFVNRLRSRDFDMVSHGSPAMQYPSSDLKILWHSDYIESTWNTSGVRDKAVDYLCEQIAASQEDGQRLLTLGRVLDRVLTWNVYSIMEWHIPKFRLAYTNKFAKPAVRPRYAVGIETWWVK